MRLWVYQVCFLVFALIIIYLTIWVSVPSIGGVHFQIDTSNVSVNNTQIIGSAPSNITVRIIDGNVVFAKIGLQNISTLINGITTSTSIIVAFSGVVITYMLRELFPTDRKAKIAFFAVLISFIYVFAYLFWVYILLATGLIDTSLRWSLDGLLLSLLIFISVILLGSYRLDNSQEKKSDKKTERDKGNDNGISTPTHDQIRYSILSILYKKAETSPKELLVYRTQLIEILKVPENLIDFNVRYLLEEQLVRTIPETLTSDTLWITAQITSSGINVIEHKEENKNRFPFLNATIPIQIQTKIGIINL